MQVWPTIFSAGTPPTMYPKPVTPTRPIAMPMGTRSSIRPKSAMNPIMATASVLMAFPLLDRLDLVAAFHLFGLEDQPPCADRDEQHGGNVADPGHGEKRPGRQAQVESEHVVAIGAGDLVEQRVGLNDDDEQQHQRREDVDDALPARARIGPDKVDRDVGATIGGRGDAPEDQNAEQQAAEIIGVGDLDAEKVTQQHRDEDVGGDDADEEGRNQLDAVDEAVHEAVPARSAASAREPPRDIFVTHDLFGHDASSLAPLMPGAGRGHRPARG